MVNFPASSSHVDVVSNIRMFPFLRYLASIDYVMLTYDAGRFAKLRALLTDWHVAIKVAPLLAVGGDIDENNRVKYCDFYLNLSNELRELLLPHSADQAKRVESRLRSRCSIREYTQMLNELQNRIDDELASQTILRLSPVQRSFYTEQEPFGSEVSTAFPSAVRDIEEAAKCHALDRHTACVLHLQRVMELGLMALGNAIGIDPAENRTWDAILKKIDPELRKGHTDRSSFFQNHAQACAEAAALLRSVKIAWRNPTMHVSNIYDETKALEVFNSVKAFMRSLARFVSE
jgi:hypothetical protein